jgi:hypothetical protein
MGVRYDSLDVSKTLLAEADTTSPKQMLPMGAHLKPAGHEMCFVISRR